MKKIIIFFYAICFINLCAYSQILKPVSWSYAAKRTGPSTATIFIKATMDQGWHIYSQFVKAGGPVKTAITFPVHNTYSLIGPTIEPKATTKYESSFKMNVSYFEKSVVFQQKMKLKTMPVYVKGRVEFMACDDKQCLPPEEVDFSILVK
ncbi:protein-disulfide reductase DsbD domain-containing protein [Pedobacter lithocola]|uniref:Protein-disulfide reductase DsbD domain-containing protein n=1 Tax=Pedobacter lithocola TaxID=1908239 RepID=A0ABV8P3J8_9SPHI